jgi:hypothetical protein
MPELQTLLASTNFAFNFPKLEDFALKLSIDAVFLTFTLAKARPNQKIRKF